MFILSNSKPVKFTLFIGNVFYKIIPYKYTVHLRCFYKFNLGLYKKFCKLLNYGHADIFSSLAIETTTYCNRRCGYCPNSVFDRGLKVNEKLMPEDMFKKIINELKEINYKGKIYPFFYGEPLLDLRLGNLIDYAHKALPNAEIIIYTNGDLLDTDKVDELYKVGVKYFVITLHSNTKQGIEKIKKIINHIKQSKKKIKILCQIFDKNTALSSRTGLVRVDNKKVEDFVCLDPVVIDYKGDFLICGHDYLGKTCVGNIRNDKLTKIWNKPDFKEIRSQLRNHKFTLDVCKSCAESQERA